MKIKLHLIFMLLACSMISFSQQFMERGFNNNNEVLTLNSEKLLSVKLPSNPSTGYSWVLKEGRSLQTLTEVDQSFETSATENQIGAPGITTITYMPTGKGLSNLELVYTRPFEENGEILNTYSLSVNSEGTYTGKPLALKKAYEGEAAQRVAGLPTVFSWRSKASPVVNQGSCGSCWAFTSTAAFEAVVNIWDNKINDFSEQFLVNCDKSQSGCSGGSNSALNTYVKYGGVLESDLPYKAANGTCKTYTYHEKARSYATVKNSQATLKQALYDYGPMYIAICAGSNFSNVKASGIVTSSDGTNLNHAVTLFGWDDDNGCWLIKNSWGSSYCDKGYLRVKYGVSGVGGAAARYDYKGIIPHNTTGIDADRTAQLTVFPNPSQGTVNFSGLKANDVIQIFDVLGKIVYETKATNNTQLIDLSNHTKGLFIYIIRDAETNNTMQGKLVIN